MKPTPEQLQRICAGALCYKDSGAVDPSSEFFADYAADAFSFIADMVLEEAEKACATVVKECPPGSSESTVAVVCASRVRAMKGSP